MTGYFDTSLHMAGRSLLKSAAGTGDRRSPTLIAAGAPIVIVLPGTVYGPNDHTAVGLQMRAAYDGTAPYIEKATIGKASTYSGCAPESTIP